MAAHSSKQEKDSIKAIEAKVILSTGIMDKYSTSDVDYAEMNKGGLDLLEKGGHCKYHLCRQFTFLPVKCHHCVLDFCKHHCKPTDHKCTNMPKENIEKRISKCPKCAKHLVKKPKHLTYIEFLKIHQASGCKKYIRKQNKCRHRGCKIAARFLCCGCNKKFCVPHRWDDMHRCTYANSCRGQVKNVPLLDLKNSSGLGFAC